MLLILINLTIFVVAALASFYRHDPHPDYEKLSDRRQKADRRLAKFKQRFQSENSRATKEFDGRIADLDRQIDGVEKDITRLEAELEAAQQAADLNELRVTKAVKSRLHQYQSGNLEARSDGEPRCFGFTDEVLFAKIFSDRPGVSTVRVLEPVKGAGSV
jgi:septal ring factor EnvC (AmiA/AmiB activator)